MPDTIVIGHDGSAGADTALSWGLALAHRRHVPVRIARAFEEDMYLVGLGGLPVSASEGLRAAAEEQTRRVCEQASTDHPGLDITGAVHPGHPETVLVEMSRSAAVLVVGSRGDSNAHTLLAGSTTMSIATHAHCPVVSVPAGVTPGTGDARLGVVVGIDGSATSEAAVAFAFRQASELGEPLTAVLAWSESVTPVVLGAAFPLVPDQGAHNQEQDALLAESLAGWAEQFPDVTVRRSVVHGRPVQVLAERSARASLLVVGCRGRSAVTSILLGSVSHGVLHLAACPVAVVHPQQH